MISIPLNNNNIRLVKDRYGKPIPNFDPNDNNGNYHRARSRANGTLRKVWSDFYKMLSFGPLYVYSAWEHKYGIHILPYNYGEIWNMGTFNEKLLHEINREEKDVYFSALYRALEWCQVNGYLYMIP